MKHILLTLCLLFGFAASAGAFTVSGTVSGGEGLYLRYVVAVPLTLDTFYVTIAGLTGSHAYNLTNLDSGSYTIVAYQDLNLNFTPDLDEPRGFYGGQVPQLLLVDANVSDIEIALAASTTGGFTGSVSYDGEQTGRTFIMAYYSPEFSGFPHGASILFTNDGNGDYTLPVDAFTTFYAAAFMDLNNNFLPDAGEPYGIYGGDAAVPIEVTETESPEGIHIALSEPNAVPAPRPLPTDPGLNAYPNPFNSTTRVEFTLPAAAPVELRLFDVQGREVRTLTAGVYAAGRHELRLEARDLASGLYFVRLVTPTQHLSRPVLLLR